eukprot:TRINITY_DN36720_c0_g1_i1.p1 TRINITY_DN36720_c0_g1~~TRINITY_DN36720_c0_g1_i1.p1  ORF type:complete len:171 (-),score=20.63 TRINITY_DN36720_c0_g1_i1:23-535(-)
MIQRFVNICFYLMIRRPQRSTQGVSSAASDVYKRQGINAEYMGGAATADFVEMSNNALQALFANIEKTKTNEVCRVHKRNVLNFLKKCQDKYDIIIIDPPYDKGLIVPTLELILANDILTENAAILIEHSRKESIPEKYGKLVSYTCDKKMATLTILEINKDVQSFHTTI